MKTLFFIAVFAALTTVGLAEPFSPKQDTRGFSLPQPGYQYEFLRDHGSHLSDYVAGSY